MMRFTAFFVPLLRDLGRGFFMVSSASPPGVFPLKLAQRVSEHRPRLVEVEKIPVVRIMAEFFAQLVVLRLAFGRGDLESASCSLAGFLVPTTMTIEARSAWKSARA